jgi:hypothetical protein
MVVFTGKRHGIFKSKEPCLYSRHTCGWFRQWARDEVSDADTAVREQLNSVVRSCMGGAPVPFGGYRSQSPAEIAWCSHHTKKRTRCRQQFPGGNAATFGLAIWFNSDLSTGSTTVGRLKKRRIVRCTLSSPGTNTPGTVQDIFRNGCFESNLTASLTANGHGRLYTIWTPVDADRHWLRTEAHDLDPGGRLCTLFHCLLISGSPLSAK